MWLSATSKIAIKVIEEFDNIFFRAFPISSIISRWTELNRPRSLLVFLNPIAGKKKALKMYREKVAPLFEIARITTTVIQTERLNHARDLLLEYNLDPFDGWVSKPFFCHYCRYNWFHI